MRKETPTCETIHAHLRALSLAELVAVDAWLYEERTAHGRTSRLVAVQCGKPRGRCVHGIGHGPDWYACGIEDRHTRCTDVGKQRPKELDTMTP